MGPFQAKPFAVLIDGKVSSWFDNHDAARNYYDHMSYLRSAHSLTLVKVESIASTHVPIGGPDLAERC